ncbi:Nn.00g077680.m01.CDS01 [Neocucurbitaria sp. VM-36]
MDSSSLPHNIRRAPEELPPTLLGGDNQGSQGNFTFGNLQGVQHIEEKAQEALLALKLNTEVLDELKKHYRHVTEHHDFPNELRRDCEAEIARFDSCIRSVEKDLFMLQSRTETLLQLLGNRKNLLNGILQYRSAQASEFLAREAQTSAASMESMTAGMHEIARKTKQETVSMRVITSVTLFFLPATFIATFMSTDILKYQDGKQNFQLKGLHMYLSIALPLTLLTFLAWYLIYFLAKRGERPNVQGRGNEPSNVDIC